MFNTDVENIINVLHISMIAKAFKLLNKEKMSMIKQNHLTQFTAVPMLAVLLGCGMAQAKEKPHNKGSEAHTAHDKQDTQKKQVAKKAKLKGFVLIGPASYYGIRHQGKKTASGERFDMYKLTAAHKSLPLHSRVRVTNMTNNKSVVVTINDRGPYITGRILDLSEAAALAIKLSPGKSGATMVRIEVL